ncbi:prion-inhibition and propagation-domain-containing protein [Aspergillus bertholletiae]|uniref:Prion-inhibition and propagation-domain-containing protein n=1 Tax=Aspergillus bertholletiae TaxID=1226010 RepID=A0A5N7AYH7_9EURO|nr:prion-inhibition and propagation-domain-containing protein [Aspergillus bertholletiae]
MDPLSILGAAVGVTSLVLQLTDECVKGYRYYSEAANFPDEYQYVMVRFQIEKQRFLNFGLEVGLFETEESICATLQVNRSLILAVLAEIRTALEKHAASYGKYVNLASRQATQGSVQESLSTEIEQLLRFYNLRQSLSQTKGNIRVIAMESWRLVWATVDKAKFEELVSRLRKCNSFLISLLDRSQIEQLQRSMNTSYMEILQIRNDIQSLKGLVEALGEKQKGVTSSGHITSVPLDRDPLSLAVAAETEIQQKEREVLKQLAEVKIQCTRVDDELDKAQHSHTNFHPPYPSFLDLTLLTFDLKLCRGLERRTMALYLDRAVWIEWKDEQLNQSVIYPTIPMVERRLHLLTDLLRERKPDGFRALPCLGYTKLGKDGEMHYGLVFEKPPEANTNTRLFSLRQLLGTDQKPSLSARISLCALLAECIYSFHAVNWLHRGIRSDNIIFFAPDTQSVDLCAPYISGFELSRPGSIAEMTEKPIFNPIQDIYRHPFAQSSQGDGSFRKSYDKYSLGIVLMEIATWKQIEDIVDIQNLSLASPRDIIQVRERLLDESRSLDTAQDGRALCHDCSYLGRIAAELGDVYTSCVELCLRADEIERPFDKGETSLSIAVRLQRTYSDGILKRLKNMESALNG